ncbi:zinc cadmium resistance protein [Apiospora kogelbergensis]|uniref:zinc cadmium resistance protein n=1 Tax=Apiospora kogelbergensis TaxID=1337665 RepID=UPI00313101F0
MAWSKSTRIGIMLAIDVVFFFVELISGIIVGSLALQADAFHMLNDIISLLVGLWAVTLAKRATTDKYSFGWLRAEILGAFFNAVFLIALCVSILLESITRFIDPPTIEQPQLILIVGCTGLASNLIGFFVLGGHGHSHGPGDHSHEGHDHDHGHEHTHDHDNAHAAEEGRAPSVTAHVANEAGPAMDALPHVALARASNGNDSPETVRRINFASENDAPGRSDDRSTGTRLDGRRRAGSLKHTRLQSIDDLNLYPSSFRQNIIDRSRSNMEESEGSTADDDSSTANDESQADENSPLVTNNGKGGPSALAIHTDLAKIGIIRVMSRLGSQMPQKPGKKGHGHNHADMGMNAMVLHVIGDALGNVGVIITALIIWLTDWPGKDYADPAVSLFITFIILRSACPLTMATANILLQATPDRIDMQDIKEDIQALPGVISCHHVHIWQLSDTNLVASMHIQVAFPITEEDGGEVYGARQVGARMSARTCNHLEVSMLTDGTLDGQATANCTNGDNPACLLECVDDCVGKGCCSVTPSQNGDNGSHKSGHSGHGHSSGHGHDHGHEHRH